MIVFLPDAFHLDIQLLEEQSPMKSQAPEYNLVVLYARKAIPWITEDDVITIDVICSSEAGFAHGKH